MGFEMSALIVLHGLLVALGIDRWLGEPPVRYHPVVWMGNYLGWAGDRVQQRTRQDDAPDYKAFWLGALAWCAGVAMVLIVAVALQASLLVRSAPSFVSDAFCQSRLGQMGQHNYGTLPRGVDVGAIIERATPRSRG